MLWYQRSLKGTHPFQAQSIRWSKKSNTIEKDPPMNCQHWITWSFAESLSPFRWKWFNKGSAFPGLIINMLRYMILLQDSHSLPLNWQPISPIQSSMSCYIWRKSLAEISVAGYQIEPHGYREFRSGFGIGLQTTALWDNQRDNVTLGTGLGDVAGNKEGRVRAAQETGEQGLTVNSLIII